MSVLNDPSYYAAWRAREMLVCARMCPTSDRSVPHTLHAAVRSLDGHPFIDSVYVEEEEAVATCGGGDETPHLAMPVVVVRATLQGDAATAEAYGLRDTDSVEVVATQSGVDDDQLSTKVARVTRRGNTWDLLAVVPVAWAASVSWAARRRVSDLVRINNTEYAIPNAPSLTVDVRSKFDPMAWRVCSY